MLTSTINYLPRGGLGEEIRVVASVEQEIET